METAKSLYSNILALVSVLMVALIISGMPLFYGLNATIDVAVILGFISGTVLTICTRMTRERKLAPVRVARLPRA